MPINNSVWGYFQSVYEDTLLSGETFSSEMGDEIKKELEKMVLEREEFLKREKEEKNGQ